jgi:flagellar basal-body rod modification protein FlgD
MISPTSTSSVTATTSSVTAADTQANSVVSSDFDTFIKMLTTQAKYQDPLEPIDGSEYAAQLAQFSMVEQQVLSNDLLTALTDQLGNNTMGQLAGWIGMEGRTTAAVPFDTAPITVLPTPPTGAQKMELVVYDSLNREVDRGALPVSSSPVLWAGVGPDGQPLAADLYRFEIEATGNGDVELPATKAATYARITEVQNIGTEARVIFAGGAEASADSITALREVS